MKNHNVLVGLFITVAVALFGAGLFLIGNQHRAFGHHVVFYTNFQNVDGLAMAWMRVKSKVSRSLRVRRKSSG
jgi:hypothetical protein